MVYYENEKKGFEFSDSSLTKLEFCREFFITDYPLLNCSFIDKIHIIFTLQKNKAYLKFVNEK